MGIAQTAGLQEYLESKLNVDLAYKSSFTKGLHQGATNNTESQRAYYVGLQIGEQVTNQMMNGIFAEVFGGKSLIPELKKRFTDKFANGFIDALSKRARYTLTEANTLANSKINKFKAILKNNQALTPALRQEADDMFYAAGIAQTDGLETYLGNTMNVNKTHISDFIRGLKEVSFSEQTKQRHAYFAGIQIGNQIASQMLNGIEKKVFNELSVGEVRKKRLQCFLDGFTDGFNNSGKYTVEKAQDIANKIMVKIKKETTGGQHKKNKERGERFLANNKTKPDVHVLPSGVQYKIIKKGTGRKPRNSSKVKVHYEWKTIYGNIFDSSYKRGEAITLKCNQVIEGWADALRNKPSGSVWEVYIPQELAYAGEEKEDIKPYSALIFILN